MFCICGYVFFIEVGHTWKYKIVSVFYIKLINQQIDVYDDEHSYIYNIINSILFRILALFYI